MNSYYHYFFIFNLIAQAVQFIIADEEEQEVEMEDIEGVHDEHLCRSL